MVPGATWPQQAHRAYGPRRDGCNSIKWVSRASLAAGSPTVADPGLTAELRAVLLAAGFTGEGVRDALGTGVGVLSGWVDIPLHVRRLAATGPLGTLIRLLVLDEPVASSDAAGAFAPLPLERVEQIGIVARDGAEAHPLVRIVPHDELLIASDRRVARGEPERTDHVAGVHGPSLTLSHLTVRRPVDTLLDVGTGCGVQAILAAPHTRQVVGTDLNARALEFAAFNAQLNGVENVDWREGSFFEPARGRYELITSNPPYVISPETAYLFRDSGMAGDAVSRLVVRDAPEYLEEGGFATLLVSWIDSGDWAAPLRAWVEGSGCDAWLLHHGTHDPLTHAGNWLRHEVGHDPEAYAAALDRWLAYLDELGAEGVAVGAVILRRREGRNWVRADELPGERLRPASEHILRVFAAEDFLAGDPPLDGERLALARHARLRQQASWTGGEWTTEDLSVVLEEGLGFRASLDPGAASMLAALDGRRTLGSIAAELEADLVPLARAMLGAGFLERHG